MLGGRIGFVGYLRAFLPSTSPRCERLRALSIARNPRWYSTQAPRRAFAAKRRNRDRRSARGARGVGRVLGHELMASRKVDRSHYEPLRSNATAKPLANKSSAAGSVELSLVGLGRYRRRDPSMRRRPLDSNSSMSSRR